MIIYYVITITSSLRNCYEILPCQQLIRVLEYVWWVRHYYLEVFQLLSVYFEAFRFLFCPVSHFETSSNQGSSDSDPVLRPTRDHASQWTSPGIPDYEMVKQSFLILEVFPFQYQQIERVDFSVESKSISLLQVEGSFLPFYWSRFRLANQSATCSNGLINERRTLIGRRMRPIPVLPVHEVEEEHFAFDHEQIVIPELYRLRSRDTGYAVTNYTFVTPIYMLQCYMHLVAIEVQSKLYPISDGQNLHQKLKHKFESCQLHYFFVTFYSILKARFWLAEEIRSIIHSKLRLERKEVI